MLKECAARKRRFTMIGETAYHNAMKRRAELRQQLEEIEQFLKLYEKFAGPQPAEKPLKAGSDERPETLSGMDLVPHIRRLILDVGRPQSRGDVVKALAARGIHVGGQEPATNIGTVMWRAKEAFINLKPLGYWPRDVPYAPAGYEPHDYQAGDDSRAGADEQQGNPSALASAGGFNF